MARNVLYGGSYVYDTEEDQHYKFDNPADGIAFAQEVESREEEVVQELGTAVINTVNITVTDGMGPFMIAPFDPSRKYLRVAIIPQGISSTGQVTLAIGSRRDVLAGSGFQLWCDPTVNMSQLVSMETSAEVWGNAVKAAAPAFGTVKVCAIMEKAS